MRHHTRISGVLVPQRLRGLLVAVGLLVGLLGTAQAHVGVTPATVAPASNVTFTVRVPNEKPEPTVRVRVEFPANLTISRFQPKPGWEREIERDSAGRIVAAIWSGGEIGPDEYEDFAFAARTPREPGPLSFPSYQTYAGGETVAWINPEGADNPAAIITIGAATAPGTDASSPSSEAPGATSAPAEGGADTSAPSTATATSQVVVTAAPAGGATTNASAATEAASGSDLPLFVALAALVVAILALALAAVAVLRRRTTA